jgi:hypothetical protein
MKRTLFFLTAAVCLLAGCSRTQKFTVSGELAATGLPKNTKTIQLISEGLPLPIEATVTPDGTFSLEGEVQKPVLAKLISDSKDQNRFPALILEKGAVTFQEGRPVGTPLNDENKAFIEQLRTIRKENADNRAASDKATEEAYSAFVAKHKNDPCAVFAILLADQRLAPEFILQLISAASPEIQNVSEVRSLATRIKKKMEK